MADSNVIATLLGATALENQAKAKNERLQRIVLGTCLLLICVLASSVRWEAFDGLFGLISVHLLVLTLRLLLQVRLFSVIKYESVIHEFDPYFNYRVTQFLTKEGFYNTWNFFDSYTWYPLGRVVGGTMYPVRPLSLHSQPLISSP